MKFFYSPKYEVDLGEHILPTIKFRLIKEKLVELYVCLSVSLSVSVCASQCLCVSLSE